MRRLYTIILYALIPLMIIRLFWKARKLPAYRQRICERFTVGPRLQSADVWLHAVSLGEVVAAIPLIEALLAKHRQVIVTTTTPTGSQRLIAHFGRRIQHQYLPYDLPWALRRFYKQVNARIAIIMETELWPNLIHYARKYGLSIVIANARISDKSFMQYKKIKFMLKPIFHKLNFILAQSEEDVHRFITLGARSDLIANAGNMKFDIDKQSQSSQIELIRQLKNQWGFERKVLIIASTHDQEEELWLQQFTQLQQHIPNLLLLIAPRHPERFLSVFELSLANHYNTALRSMPASIEQSTEVIILDCLGELLSFYQVCDYAFIGGSLVPVGGHNVLEPIAMQVPVLTGPYMQNSKSICQDLSIAGAIEIANNIDELVSKLITLDSKPHLREKQIKNANTVMDNNKGAVLRHLQVIDRL